MLNQTILVGRLVENSELNETSSGKRFVKITLAVPRCYKNVNGEYETDFIPCILWNGLDNILKYCKKNDVIAVKGVLQTKDDKVVVIAEKTTFLSSGKDKENE